MQDTRILAWPRLPVSTLAVSDDGEARQVARAIPYGVVHEFPGWPGRCGIAVIDRVGGVG